MKENERISDMFARFTDIVNELEALGQKYTQSQLVRKVLMGMTPDWQQKTFVIEQSHGMAKYNIKDLIGNLMAVEVRQNHYENLT